MKNIVWGLGLLLMCGSWTSQPKTIILKEGEIREIAPGDYSLDLLVLGRNSALLLTGTTRMVVGKMITEPNARIEYKKGAQPQNPQKRFELTVRDGSGMRGITNIIGTGWDGENGTIGATGATGGNESIGFNWKGPWHHDASPGGKGGRGGDGIPGEDAMDLEVYIHGLYPRAFVSIITNGGKGGDGGKGGQGGQGGSGQYYGHGAPGGPGGLGGDGKKGGNAGNIIAKLIYQNSATKEDIKRLEVFLEKNIIALPGIGGIGGAPGNGGNGGNGGEGPQYDLGGIEVNRGSGDGGSGGQKGNGGGPGKPGTVTKGLISVSQYLEQKAYLETLFPVPKTNPK